MTRITMNMDKWLHEKLILPASDYILGNTYNQHFKFLQKSQWWSKEEISAYQNDRLRLLIDHAYNNVPYYNDVFKRLKLTPSDIKTQEDLHKLPILTKEIIRENFPNKIVATGISKKNLILSGSSGSTGQPLQYFRTKDSLSFSRASNLRSWYWMGFRLGDPYIKISTWERNSFIKKVQDQFNRCTFINSLSLTIENIRFAIDKIRQSKSLYLRGYPASLYLIASYMSRNNIDDIYLKGISTTSEPLYPNQRKMIESQFHCPVFDSYSCEGGAVIAQCEYHDLYHIGEEQAIVEFYRNGSRVDNGKAKMIFTNLTNFVTPFIRYDVKDYAIINQGQCKCNRGLSTIERIEGRDTDILVTPDGRYITFYYFAGYFEHKDYIDQFQLTQVESTSFILKIVPNSLFRNEYLSMMHRDFISVLGEKVNLEIDIVSDIPLTKSGKRRFFVRDPNISIDF
jgi:phenylacetate-CoA ligase